MDDVALHLVTAARSGDRDALAALWTRERSWLAAVLAAQGAEGSDLDDLLQDCALHLLKDIGKLREPAAFRPWCRRMALNLGAARGRREARRSHRSLEEMGGLEPSAPDRPGDDGLVSALREIPPAMREVLLLRAVDGLGDREIAGILELTVEAVESRLARGRRRLREALERRREREAARPVNGESA
ncbi:MAG: RNA polymerase sigma factor [Planctomycetota bacterium]